MGQRSYRRDRKWADKYTEIVRKILTDKCAQFIMSIEISTDYDDTKRATDMVATVKGGGDIAVRLRRDDCAHRDWTIRSLRSSGTKTELAKLREGWAKFYLYGWTGSGITIPEWVFIDVDRCRDTGVLSKVRYDMPNGDGTFFYAITTKELRRSGCLLRQELLGQQVLF